MRYNILKNGGQITQTEAKKMRVTITANDLKKAKKINGVDANAEDLKALFKNVIAKKDAIKEIIITSKEINIITK